MKNLLKKFLFIALFVNVVACGRYMSSPGIWFFNMSDDYIYTVRGNWSGYYVLGNTELPPGDSPSQNLILKNQSDIFGPVHLQFKNAKGELIQKDFTFTKDQLPDTKYHNFDHIYIFLTQDGFEIFTRGRGEEKSEEILEKRRKVTQLGREHDIVCSKGPITSLTIASTNKRLSINECKKLMPIYKPENMPRINQYRKLYDAYEAQRLENVRQRKEKVKNNVE